MFSFNKPLAFAAAALLLVSRVHADSDLLPGYGNGEYDPVCGYACRYAMPTTLNCPEYANMTAEEIADAYPSGSCFAQDVPYLTSMAYCIHSYCEGLKMSEIDVFWETQLFYEEEGTVPVLTYLSALNEVDLNNPPTPYGVNDTVLNRTVSLDAETYLGYSNAVTSYKEMKYYSSMFRMLMFLSGVCFPIGLTAISKLPWPTKWVSTFNGYVIDPPLFGRYHSVPVLGLGMIPTRGQALFIMYLIGINLAANFAGYPRITPDAWYPSRKEQLTDEIANRAGDLALANFPLVILYAGRNNLLLWLSNWSHASFLLIHRWIALICVLQACLHSAMWVQIELSYHYYTESARQPYWYYGIIATLCFSLLIPFSILPLRKRWYEFFLIAHIIFVVIAIVGVWYHIDLLYEHTEGFDIFIYLAIGIWVLDRSTRWLRVSKIGLKRGYVSRIDEEYIRVDVPGVDCHGYCYAYFPTLSWRIWENHPFSVVGCNPSPADMQPSSPISHSDSECSSPAPQLRLDDAAKKEAGITSRTRSIAVPNSSQKSGITLYIRVHSGLTKLLARKCGDAGGLPILVESSYGHEGKTVLQGADSKFAPTPEYPNLLCIAGGVGVTAVLPALQASLSLYGPIGSTKLYWGLRGRGLVDSIESMLLGHGNGSDSGWGHIEPHITVGERINVRRILEEELEHCSVGTTVVVCGPLAMCDEVRYTVAAMARHGKTLRFIEESLPW